MSSIRELARRCGVSVATVSRVFNTPEVVSQRTRQHVLDMAAEIGYLPNESARTLATKKSNMVGLVWDTDHRRPGWRHPFLQDILVALKSALSAQGLHLLMLAPDQSAGLDPGQRFVRAVQRHNVDGVVVIDNGSRDPAVLALADAGVPCVALDLRFTGPRCTYITSDNHGGGRLAAAHLIERGHRRIATITGPLPAWPAVRRLAGFRAALAEAGVPLADTDIESGDWYLDSGHAAMNRLLARDPRPTAVFAAGDEMAVGAMRAIHEAGLRIPDDIAIIGFDDIEVAALIPPGLTTIAQDKTGIGTGAAEAMVAMLLGTAPPPGPTTLPTTLVTRGST
ncbi:LacI family DNA-binding transcriptional regulator [Actinoplanes teichomyceticus]|uniref:LacI family transcriptional regulator n=1 Tax=Actinoplanes teichomyceticus TaxID=1867 RepID=A0A561WBK1_ACTTI|nr:LacI family DNA-binding transcriptional regulator [Actinoplanes teichomyceticus]TWG21247.1 LacI family transcriptional regulator [Actinoplanes teichomyceticus]GIF16739.1 LacI family transcriptional regulator [Actinoplanes teichomyceticus]